MVYFQAGNPAGYVLHETPDTKLKSIMISVGPFFVNTILGGLIALPAALPVFSFGTATLLDYFLIYLAVSIAMHAFPSTGDANVIWEAVNEEGTSPLVKIVAYPIVGLIYLGSIGSFFWLDLAYGVGVAIGFPNLLVWILS